MKCYTCGAEAEVFWINDYNNVVYFYCAACYQNISCLPKGERKPWKEEGDRSGLGYHKPDCSLCAGAISCRTSWEQRSKPPSRWVKQET